MHASNLAMSGASDWIHYHGMSIGKTVLGSQPWLVQCRESHNAQSERNGNAPHWSVFFHLVGHSEGLHSDIVQCRESCTVQSEAWQCPSHWSVFFHLIGHPEDSHHQWHDSDKEHVTRIHIFWTGSLLEENTLADHEVSGLHKTSEHVLTDS